MGNKICEIATKDHPDLVPIIEIRTNDVDELMKLPTGIYQFVKLSYIASVCEYLLPELNDGINKIVTVSDVHFENIVRYSRHTNGTIRKERITIS